MSRATGLCVGARDLLANHHGSQLSVAETYIKGEIPKHLAPYVWHLINESHVEEAKQRIDRESWGLIHRVKELEKEIRELRATPSSVVNTFHRTRQGKNQ